MARSPSIRTGETPIVCSLRPFIRVSLLILCLSLLLPGAEYSHRVWRTEDGLPQNRIQAIAQTPDGYLWIGTSEGLARFDGSRFITFDRSNTPAITDNSIFSLEAVRDGSLWIGTEGGGLVHYSRRVFRSYGAAEGLTNGFVRASLLDRFGRLWVGTDHGFFRFENEHFVRVDNTPQVPFASITGIAEDPTGKIWASSAQGLLEVNDGKLQRALCFDTKDPGLFVVSMIREGLIPDGCHSANSVLPPAPRTALLKDAAGNVWVATLGEGLITIDGRTGARTSYSSPSTLPDSTVLTLFEDRQHNIWAGAQDGLVRFSRAVVTTLASAEGLADDNVTTTFEDRAGVMWIVTFSGQIYRMEAGAPHRYYLPASVRDLRYRSVFLDSRGDYWFATSGAGAVRLSNGSATRYTRQHGLRSDSIRQIYEDSRGTMWFATSSGLSSWSKGVFTSYYLNEGLSYPSVRCLAEVNGDVIAGTDAGLNRIHQGRIVEDATFASLKDEKVWSLYVEGGKIWAGTRGGGLVLIDNGKATRFTTQEGLVSNSIYQIVDDHAGRLWLSSPVGVSWIAKTELDSVTAGRARLVQSVNYGTAEGMATSQMSGGLQSAGCRRSSGDLWFPSVRGAVRLTPSRLPAHRSGPVMIENVSASDATLLLSGEVAIPAGRDRLEIDFTACNLAAPQQVRFRYRLEGFDDSWIPASRQRSAFYSNLPPGHYLFKVMAEDADADGSQSEASIAIYKAPSFFQTAWFYSLMAALLACAAWGALWIYTRQTKSRFALLLNERTRLAREMHDTVIQGCVGVSALLEAAARFQRTNLSEAADLLAQARSQIKETLEEARRAVWNLRHSDGSRSPLFDLFDLARKLGREHGANVETEIEGKRVSLDPATDRALLLVGREALRNAVQHAHPARISVRIVFESSNVRMEIEDDGVCFDSGRSDLEERNHFGIIGMRERVEQLGGVFELSSNPGNGTLVVAEVPLSSDEVVRRRFQNSTIPR